MPLPSLKVWLADTDFLDSDINGNFTTIKNKFSEVAGQGIADGDCASDMALSGLKLSNSVGKQLITDRIAIDAIEATRLRSSAADDTLRAVTRNHMRLGIVSKDRVSTVVGEQLTKSQVAIVHQEKAFTQVATSITDFVFATTSRITISGNYGVRFNVYGKRTSTGTIMFVSTENVMPTTPIPVTSSTLLAVLIVDTVESGGFLNGNIAFVSITNS